MSIAHLTQMVGTSQHIVSRAPSNIAMEGNLQRVADLALDLQLFEVFDTLTRGLDLNRNGSNGRNHVKRSSKDAVAR